MYNMSIFLTYFFDFQQRKLIRNFGLHVQTSGIEISNVFKFVLINCTFFNLLL